MDKVKTTKKRERGKAVDKVKTTKKRERGRAVDKGKTTKKRRKMVKQKAAQTDTSQKQLLSFCFSGTSAAAASACSIAAVYLHFRCWNWQARILDANGSDQ